MASPGWSLTGICPGLGSPSCCSEHPLASPPARPAWRSCRGGRSVTAASWRIGPERFKARAWLTEAELSGDRRADVAALTEAMARRMEEAISLAPEQWFAAFQPIWDEERSRGG